MRGVSEEDSGFALGGLDGHHMTPQSLLDGGGLGIIGRLTRSGLTMEQDFEQAMQSMMMDPDHIM
jgi:hypothetical protein